MSESTLPKGDRRDVGATLAELLIGVVLLGIIMTSLSAAGIVIVWSALKTVLCDAIELGKSSHSKKAVSPVPVQCRLVMFTGGMTGSAYVSGAAVCARLLFVRLVSAVVVEARKLKSSGAALWGRAMSKNTALDVPRLIVPRLHVSRVPESAQRESRAPRSPITKTCGLVCVAGRSITSETAEALRLPALRTVAV
jgi:hypothetical protein